MKLLQLEKHHMPVIFSFNFILFAISGAAFGTGVYKLTGIESLAVLVGGITATAMDVYWRTGSNSNHPAIDPELGGHVYFIPTWIIGTIVSLAGMAMMVGLL